jgi:hypothetical protein
MDEANPPSGGRKMLSVVNGVPAGIGIERVDLDIHSHP